MLEKDDVAVLAEAMNELKGSLETFREKRTNTQTVHQHLNTGGHAVWVVVVMAAIIFTAAITQGPRLSELERKQDRMQDYLNNIYQQAPWLRPQEITSVDDNHHYNSSSAPALDGRVRSRRTSEADAAGDY